MADQERSDLDVVFTVILYTTNFLLVSYEAHIHKLGSNSFREQAQLISKLYDLK